MTLQDLYSAVSQLGFEDSLGDSGNDGFIYAVNRALEEVNSLRPRCRRVDINHKVPKNLITSEPTVIEKRGGETLEFTAVGAKSFYFEVCGEGSFTVGLKKKNGTVIGNTTVPRSFVSKTFIPQRGFIKYGEAFIDSLLGEKSEFTGEAVIRFEGSYDYTVRNLAMYDRVYSSSEASIMPYGNMIAYDISKIAEDFDVLEASPIDYEGKHLNQCYGIEGSTLFLPKDKQGIYTIKYLHKVEHINLNADFRTVEIDLEEDLAVLLPNLVAAYVWLDDEPEKAQYYLSLYHQRAEQIKRRSRDFNPVAFESVNGW